MVTPKRVHAPYVKVPQDALSINQLPGHPSVQLHSKQEPR